MIAAKLYENNKLIRRTILKMYPSSFAAQLTTVVALMVDTLLAGAVLGQQAIASVAIGLPAIGIFQALTQTVINGSGIRLAIYSGRGEREKLRQTYCLGLASTAALGIFFICIGARENHYAAFTLTLPVSRADAVRGRVRFAVCLELMQLALGKEIYW